jgi:integrase
MDKDLVADFSPPKGKSGFAPRVLTVEELVELIEAPDRRIALGRRNAAVLVCMGFGGLRVGEICGLNSEDVLCRPHEVVLTVNGKGRKRRSVTLPGAWASLFRSYQKMWPRSRRFGSPFFWCGPGKDRRITPAAIAYLVKGEAETAGLPPLNPHALRHTAATLAIQSGSPIHVVQAMLGHSSIQVTARYLHC